MKHGISAYLRAARIKRQRAKRIKQEKAAHNAARNVIQVTEQGGELYVTFAGVPLLHSDTWRDLSWKLNEMRTTAENYWRENPEKLPPLWIR